jgi:hypothetical protein
MTLEYLIPSVPDDPCINASRLHLSRDPFMYFQKLKMTSNKFIDNNIQLIDKRLKLQVSRDISKKKKIYIYFLKLD